MTNRYNSRGQRVPVTILQVEPNVVVDVKEQKTLIGLGAKKRIKKTENGFISKVGIMPRYLKEVKKEGEIKIGDKITVALFSPGDAVKVTGTTKGHGFSGGVKRWGFHGGPKTHGQSDRHRAPGSIGQGTTPGRVYRGKHMAGQYGNVQFTVTGLEVLGTDLDQNLLFVKGAVPGARNGFVVIEKTGKVKKYVAPPEEKPKDDEEAAAENTENKTEGTEKKSDKQEEVKEEKDAK